MAYDILKREQVGRDWSCGIEEMGNILTPTSVLNKMDDVRYDLRNIGGNVTGGIYALAGAFAALAFAKIYKSAKERRIA